MVEPRGILSFHNSYTTYNQYSISSFFYNLQTEQMLKCGGRYVSICFKYYYYQKIVLNITSQSYCKLVLTLTSQSYCKLVLKLAIQSQCKLVLYLPIQSYYKLVLNLASQSYCKLVLIQPVTANVTGQEAKCCRQLYETSAESRRFQSLIRECMIVMKLNDINMNVRNILFFTI